MRRLTVVCAALVLLALGACGNKQTPATPGNQQASPPKACPDKIPFVASYLPPGFTPTLQDGPAAGKPTIKNVTIRHYNGNGGQYVEFLRGGKRDALNGSAGMIVLNHLARIGPIDHGFAINFRTAPGRCGQFQVVSNTSSAELVKVGHGLRAAA